jgi:ketosteroid isomerase-like protein
MKALPDQDILAIRQLFESHMQAQLAGDWAAAAAVIAEDAIAMPANQPLMQGRQAWLEWMEAARFEVVDLQTELLEIDGREDLGYLRGRYSATLKADQAPEPVAAIGKFLWILRKQANGSWLVCVTIGNSDAAAPRD